MEPWACSWSGNWQRYGRREAWEEARCFDGRPGHCEVTRGLDRPLIAWCMVGEIGGKVLSSANMRIGDWILMTKTAGIEGTAILASEYLTRLTGMKRETIRKAQSLAKYISIVEEAMGMSKMTAVNARHDPTEGGVLNGLSELAEASGLGIAVW